MNTQKTVIRQIEVVRRGSGLAFLEEGKDAADCRSHAHHRESFSWRSMDGDLWVNFEDSHPFDRHPELARKGEWTHPVVVDVAPDAFHGERWYKYSAEVKPAHGPIIIEDPHVIINNGENDDGD